jgi:hypothetical protein
MNKFDKIYSKIITECATSLFNKKLYKEHWFAPKRSFKITEDMLVNPGVAFNVLCSWAGKVKEILSEDEIIYEVCAKYFERPANDDNILTNVDPQLYGNFCRITCKPVLIRYKLKPGESYYICDKVDPHCKWLEVKFE